MHHADEAAIAASRQFQHILLSGPNRITVEVNLPLRAGTYTYDAQGRTCASWTGRRFVSFNTAGTSTLTFDLPDREDAPGYDYRQELYAACPRWWTCRAGDSPATGR